MENSKDLKQYEETAFNQPQFSKLGSGLFMVLLGGIFLTLNYFDGWDGFGGKTWLIFLLIPVFGVLMGVYQRYEANGRQLNAEVLTPLLWGLFPFAFVTLLTLGVQMQLLWPLVLVIIGLTILVKQN